MDLYSTERNLAKTVFLESGRPMYSTKYENSLFGVQSKGIVINSTNPVGRMARIHFHSLKDDEVTVQGYDLRCRKAGMFSSAQTFVASNSMTYKWKWSGSDLILERDGISVGSFDHGSRGILSKKQNPCLHLMPEVIPIRDEVVATAVYMVAKKMYKKQEAKKQNASKQTHKHGFFTVGDVGNINGGVGNVGP
ncbi:hypothetical protein DL96DRAFT_1812695 [Flagelloscypha sp. PMI_526]|nr:hypothetical protein DL96DRAFT_1812695 [Flagelloscypha sp. PMI_526]